MTEELFGYTLACAETDELRIEPVNIRSILEESLAGFYQQLSSRSIIPELQFPDDTVIRQLDKNALRRVFDNLIGNAVKYSEGDLSISLTENGKIAFSNTTATLDQLTVGRLFDRFYTVESAGNSTGIGLSAAKILTEKMGGSICAELQNGKLKISVQL